MAAASSNVSKGQMHPSYSRATHNCDLSPCHVKFSYPKRKITAASSYE
jgi:hypothetical protein